MSREKSKNYPTEFKTAAVRLVSESNLSISQIAQDLGVKEATLQHWVRLTHQPRTTSKTIKSDDPLYKELKQLRKEVARLTEERNILKKAAAYFAKDHL
jgi:transposase